MFESWDEERYAGRTPNCSRRARFSSATCSWPPRIKKSARINDKIVFNMAPKVSRLHRRKSTAYQADWVLAKHNYDFIDFRAGQWDLGHRVHNRILDHCNRLRF